MCFEFSQLCEIRLHSLSFQDVVEQLARMSLWLRLVSGCSLFQLYDKLNEKIMENYFL